MAARDGLEYLIDLVRGYAHAEINDYTILLSSGDNSSYWDDDQVQGVLDQHRQDFYHEPLQKIPDHAAGGSLLYKKYVSRYRHLEKVASGTAVFLVEDSTGANVGTADYSVDYHRGVITFVNDTGGSTYYLTGRQYNLYGAAADIWRQKAAHVANRYDFQSGDQKFKRGSLIENYFQMAEYYEKMAGPTVVTMHRSDA